jgi:hypothetical protein
MKTQSKENLEAFMLVAVLLASAAGLIISTSELLKPTCTATVEHMTLIPLFITNIFLAVKLSFKIN